MPAHDIVGSGSPAIVLIHGGCCDRTNWRLQIEALERSFTVLAPDLRGHGASGGADARYRVADWAREIVALSEDYALEQCVFVGHSLGTRIAAEAALICEARAVGLILVDGSRTLPASRPSAPNRNATAPAETSLRAILEQTVGPFAPVELRSEIVSLMEGASPETMQAAVSALAEWDRDQAERVFSALPEDLPVLAIQSTYYDGSGPRHSLAPGSRTTPYLEQLRRMLPQIETVVLADTGHFSMLERPHEITQRIAQFANAAAAR